MKNMKKYIESIQLHVLILIVNSDMLINKFSPKQFVVSRGKRNVCETRVTA